MYNYVVSIRDYKTDEPIALKEGETKNTPSKRFKQICKVDAKKYFDREVYIELLYLIGGDYDKATARLIEDTFRLYFLKKFGIDKVFKRDYFITHNLPKEYDVEKEIEDIKNLILPFSGSGAKLLFTAKPNYISNIYCENKSMTVFKTWEKMGIE